MVRGFDIQFNWIFVLIAGALILAMFFGIAMKQRSLSEQKLSVALSSDLENILTSAVVSKGTAQVLPVPRELSFSCSGGCDCRFSVGSASKSFSDLVIFGPARLEGDGVVWSVDWNAPYRVSNLLLIASPDIKYYFVGQSAVLNRVVERLPPQIVYGVVPSVANVVDEGYDSLRFIFFSGVEPPPSFAGDSSALALNNGLVEFFVQDGDGWVRTSVVPFPGFDLFLAGVFVSDDVMFGCDVRSAFRKAEHVARVMSARASELQRVSSYYNSSCYYGGAVSLFDQQADAARGLSAHFAVDGFDAFGRLASQIDQLNRQLVQRSCPGLF